jgi:hypothetical protein
MTRVWNIPVIIGGAALVIFAGLAWTALRPVAPTASATTTSAADMSSWERAKLECDRQVQILLTTKDLVELERARTLIHELDCSVSRRLPPP